MRIIIIECEVDELDEVLERFEIARERTLITTTSGETSTTTTTGENDPSLKQEEKPLTSRQIGILTAIWNALQPGAKHLLAELATRPDHYPFDKLDDQLRRQDPTWTAKRRTGIMSSIGHQMRPYERRSIPPLVERDWYHRFFYMDPRVATLIRELATKNQETGHHAMRLNL